MANPAVLLKNQRELKDTFKSDQKNVRLTKPPTHKRGQRRLSATGEEAVTPRVRQEAKDSGTLANKPAKYGPGA